MELYELERLIDGTPDDPEDTLFVALTQRDLAIVVLGLRHVADVPGCRDAVKVTNRKLMEVSAAQAFLPDADDLD